MRRLVLLLLCFTAFACDKKPGGVADVTPEQVAGWLNAKEAIVLDANTDGFRQENGVVPGAVLLANYLDWDPPSVLGPDKAKRVVFYCTNRL